MTYTLLLYPQPDPVTRESRDREKLLEVISDESFDVYLPCPLTELTHWPTHFAVHTTKQNPSLTFWEIRPRLQNVKKWETYLPLPVMGVIFPLSDPKFTSSSDSGLIDHSAAIQKMITSAMIDDIKDRFDVPIIFVYMKRWSDSLQIEELLDANLMLNTHQLSYSADDLFNLPADIANILSKHVFAVPTLDYQEWLSCIGIGKNVPEAYVEKVWHQLKNQNKECVIWLEIKEIPSLENILSSDKRKALIKDPLHHLKYMDYTIAIPTRESESLQSSLIPAYYMYVECEGMVYNSIDSLWGTLPLESFQNRFNSTRRVHQIVTANTEESGLADILNWMVKLNVRDNS